VLQVVRVLVSPPEVYLVLEQVEQTAALAALNMLSLPQGVGVIAPAGQ